MAKSTHAGLPWLLVLRRKLGAKVRFWPFDGWEPVSGRSVIAEVYPALWKHTFPPGDRDPHQHDAYCAAAWMARGRLVGGTTGNGQRLRIPDREAKAWQDLVQDQGIRSRA